MVTTAVPSYTNPVQNDLLNPLPTKANCFKKQESMYKVLTPNIKPPYKFLLAYGHFRAP